MLYKIQKGPKIFESFESLKDKPKVIIGLAADYGNLGDVAITHAQKKILENMYPNHEIIEIPISKTFSQIKALKRICDENDIITTVGGGNMGDLYWGTELQRQLFFYLFRKNKIISFPQSIEFTNTTIGKKREKYTVKQYNKCSDLTLLTREKTSFTKMQKIFPKAKVLLVPDVVMTLNECRDGNRENIVLCLRDDQEQKLSADEKKEITTQINEKYDNVITYDTHIGRDGLTAEEQTGELNKIWTLFSNSKVVVTDRLHGMIFCYITKTPCVALQNNNPKVKGCYEWLEKCGYIYLCESNDIHEVLSQVKRLSNYTGRKKDLTLDEVFNKSMLEIR